MNLLKIFTVTVILVTLQSCATKQATTTLWVSGSKVECDAGAGKIQCLQIHKGENIDNPKWENFYSTIEGFTFEKGFLKKIEVKEEQVKNPPADASSIKYTLVKELKKQVDFKAQIDGKWRLARLNGNPINRMVKLPEMLIKSNEMQVSGTGGCNNYSGEIKKLTSTSIELGPIISTKMACINENIEQEYFEALNTVSTYKIEKNELSFLNSEGNEALFFIPAN
ncbi:MAG: DUF4377 domain-containing protein [Patiriisocius sp.]|uniref:DUF4377 domain-containing protein n=1 Tax=Patiriisocius sp. TaxID=2822396 RepID=UPI003EFA5D80